MCYYVQNWEKVIEAVAEVEYYSSFLHKQEDDCVRSRT